MTEGERGLIWYDETGTVSRLAALPVSPRDVIDSSGAGDVFHGAYIASHLSRPQVPWREHFEFARAAAAFKIQHLGNETGLPNQADIGRMVEKYPISAGKVHLL